MAITPKPAGGIAAPNTLTGEATGNVAIPNTLTGEAVGDVSAPNTLTGEAVGTVAAPNTLTGEAVGDIAAPNTLSGEAVGDVAAPNTLASQSVGSVAAPNTVTTKAVGAVAAPNTISGVTAAAFPRTLTSLVDLNFAANSFAQNGVAKDSSDILTYSRPSSATFTNRRLDVNGDWEYFLDTDYVGNVTNLVTYSEQFDNASWDDSGVSIINKAAISPTGTLTATKLVEANSNSKHYIRKLSVFSAVGNAFSYVLHVKEAEKRYLVMSNRVSITGSSANTYIFDTRAGLWTSTNQSQVEFFYSNYKGDGWWEIGFTTKTISSSYDNFLISMSNDPTPSDGGVTYQGDGTSGIYIWGAQLTQSAKPLPYVKTISAPVTQTFAETLRIEYNPETGENLGALIEGGSTNLALRSEEFDNASWNKSDSNITPNSTLSPDNTLSADTFSPANGSFAPAMQDSFPVYSGSVYTTSFFVKKQVAGFVQIFFGGSSVANAPRANFNISENVLGTVDSEISASICDAPNGWSRITVTATAVSTSMQVYIALIKSGSDSRSQTNSWSSGQGAYIWGAQLESLPFASSYIRTEGAAVSRSADNLSMPSAGNVPVPSHEQTITSQFSSFSDGANKRVYEINGVTGANDRRQLYLTNNITYRYQTYIANTSAYTVGVNYDISVIYNSVNSFLYSDNVLVNTGTPLVTSSDQNTLYVGSFNNVDHLYGHISKFTTYNKAMTAQEVLLS